MSKYKSLLKSYEIVVVKRIRTCKHNKEHKIFKGERCLVIKEDQTSKPPYCMRCAYEIFKQAYKAVSEEFGCIEESIKPKIVNF